MVESPKVCTFLAEDAVQSITTKVIRRRNFVFILQFILIRYSISDCKSSMFFRWNGVIFTSNGYEKCVKMHISTIVDA